MKICFDLDGTLVGEADRSLQPNARKVLTELSKMGCELYLWSRGGEDWARFWNEHVIKFPFKDIFDKASPKISPDLAIDNDGWGVPIDTLCYWVESYKSSADKDIEKFEELIDVVKTFNASETPWNFITDEYIKVLRENKKLRFSDFEENENWKPWTERK